MKEPNADEILKDVPTGRDTRHVALVSGGMDSTTAAHVACQVAPKIDCIAYLDTQTGLDANREYIETLADELGVQLWTLRTHNSYEDRVRDNGFPGPSRHSIYYRSLKERQIGKLATMTGDQDLVLWTGVRSQESERRMAHVSRVQEADRWTWVAPIHDWSKDDCREYVDGHELPRNDLWDTLGRSGDCYCGCFGNREELIDLEAVGEEDHAEWLRAIESDIVDDFGKKGRWAWGSMEPHEFAIEEIKEGKQMTLCSNCSPSLPVAPDDDDEEDDD